jgi:hypothetical protein
VIETGASHDEQALCVRLSGAYIIDLRPLPIDPARVLRAIADIAAKIEQAPEPIQLWIAGTKLLDSYSGNTDRLMELIDGLHAATKRVQPKLIVEPDAPQGVVFILRSLGFEVFLPGLKLTTTGGGEIDPFAEIERIRRAPRVRV